MNRRLVIAMLLSLLPWPAVWLGMYELNSIIWAFVLYHGVCLMPAIVRGWPLWRGGLRRPKTRHWLWLVGAMVTASVFAIALYQITGKLIVDRDDVLSMLTRRGYQATWLLPISFYLVLVNATLEELFWRGVVLNELEPLNARLKYFGTAWAAVTFASWHWLVFRELLRPGWAELSVLVLIAIAVYTSWLYRKTKSIILPILIHAFVLDLAVIAVFVALSG